MFLDRRRDLAISI